MTPEQYNAQACGTIWDQAQLPRTWGGRKYHPNSPNFTSAVKSFQINTLLRADGKLGPGTWGKMQHVLGKETQGIDVSKYQGLIDWVAVAAAGYEYVILKATEGVKWTDPTLRANALGAHNAGMRVSYYHFGTPHNITEGSVEADALKEAKDFCTAISTLPAPSLMEFTSSSRLRKANVWLDLEKDVPNLTKEQGLLWVCTWVAEVERQGYFVGFYTSDSWFRAEVANYYNLYQRTDDSLRPIWVARYGSNDGTMQIRYNPDDKVPDEWGVYDCWQFSSKGHVPGIQGDCDLNIATLLSP